MLIVDHRLPKSVLILVVHQREGVYVLEEILVSNGQGQFPLVMTEVFTQGIPNRKDRFFLLLEVILVHANLIQTTMFDMQTIGNVPRSGRLKKKSLTLLGFADLLGEIIFKPDHFNQVQLSFRPIHAFFRLDDHALHKFTAS